MQDLLLTIDKKDLLQELLSLVLASLTINKTEKSTKLTSVYSEEDIEYTVKQLATTFRLFCLQELTVEEFTSRFVHLPSEFQQIIQSTVKARKDEILSALTTNINCRSGDVMTSFDWDIRWILGNSSYSGYRTQIVNLLLNLQRASGVEKQLQMELTKQDVEKLIDLLENSAVV